MAVKSDQVGFGNGWQHAPGGRGPTRTWAKPAEVNYASTHLRAEPGKVTRPHHKRAAATSRDE